MGPGPPLMRPPLLPQHLLRLPHGAARHFDDLGTGGDAPDRTVHGEDAAHKEDSGRIEGVFS